MLKPLVIYHKNCPDGFAAAWCFWHKFKDDYEYFPGIYNGSIPDIVDREVYLVDFSYKRKDMSFIVEYAKNVVLLDHHKSALEDLWDLPGLDMRYSSLAKSGARLAWEYVYGDKPAPTILRHIEDRDMWWFKMEGTRDILASVFSYEYNFSIYEEFMSLTKKRIENFRYEGAAINRKQEKDIKELIDTAMREVIIGDFLVPVVNAPYMMASEIGNRLAERKPFAATYMDTYDHRVFSLRSHVGGLDVSHIALQYNGGGHERAAGFKVPRDHELAKF